MKKLKDKIEEKEEENIGIRIVDGAFIVPIGRNDPERTRVFWTNLLKHLNMLGYFIDENTDEIFRKCIDEIGEILARRRGEIFERFRWGKIL
ncbi:MAG: hypothetical protein ACXQS8_06660 [Candidatus Helarchaeales archaeon]